MNNEHDSNMMKGPDSVRRMFDIPRIQRKMHQKIARQNRNAREHEKMFPGKDAQMNTVGDNS